jgi:tetratricopeptide (TPR) repeat protein
MTKTNHYVFKAMEDFDYNIEFAAEALEYALAYDENNTMALTLMGRLYAEKLFDYETAIDYFKQALAEKVNAFEVYQPYIDTLMINEDFKEANEFIKFAFTVKGVNKAMLYLNQAVMQERLFDYEKAMLLVKEAEKHNYDVDFGYRITDIKTRIEGKMPKKDASKSSASKKKKKKKEPKSNNNSKNSS